VLSALLGFALGVVLMIVSKPIDNAERIAVLETQREETTSDILEIKSDVKEILKSIKELESRR
jgi:hypothetical protein